MMGGQNDVEVTHDFGTIAIWPLAVWSDCRVTSSLHANGLSFSMITREL